MTFGEMLVNTHPNANIGYIVINNKQYPLYTAPNDYWIDKNNIIYNNNSLFANLREASFTNSPTTLDRFTFSAIPFTQTKEKTYYGVIYL